MKLKNIFALAFSAALLLGGCAKDNMSDEGSGAAAGKASIRFSLGGSAKTQDPKTRATGDNTQAGTEAALDKEKTVNSIMALLFNEDGSGLFMMPELMPDENNLYEITASKPGVYNMYLVANADYDLRNLIQTTLGEESTVADLGALLAAQAPDKDNEFLMTSAEAYRFEATPGNTTNAGEIALRRASVRIDLINMMNNATIKKIVFNNRTLKSHVLTQNAMPAGDGVFETKTYDGLNIEGNVDAENAGRYEAKIYTYENYTPKDGATIPSLTIYYDKAGVEKQHTIEFKDSKSGDPTQPETLDPLALKRNYLYRITLTNDFPLKFNLEVLDWEEAETFNVEKLETKLEPLTYTDQENQAWFIVDPNNQKVDGSELMNWYVATGTQHGTYNPSGKKACPDGWRVPTRNELIIMWVYNESRLLPNAKYGVFTPETMIGGEMHYYWPSTNGETTSSAYGIAGNGKVNQYVLKTLVQLTRCVRDVDTPAAKQYPYEAAYRIIVSRDEDGGVCESALLTSEQIAHLNTVNTTEKENRYDEFNSLNHVSTKFQVAAKNCSGQYNFTEAYDACKDYYEGTENDPTTGKGKWRVPNQREFLLVKLMAEQKNTQITNTNSNFAMGTYDSSAEASGEERMWVSHYNRSYWSFSIRGVNDKYPIRCIRDITD